jgi:formylglycine-generating enzyme required for sulfatase activity
MRRRRWLVVFAVASTACSLLVDVAGLTGGNADDTGDHADAGDDRGDADVGRDGTSEDADASDDHDGGPGHPDAGDDGAPSDAPNDVPRGQPGPTVDGGTFTIDSHEVTQSEYVAFLQAKNGDTSGQPDACAWNATYAPIGCNNAFDPSVRPNYPVTCVDWCDAYAFCAWRGERLCGAIDGGTVPNGQETAPNVDQWFAACTNKGSGLDIYPYGLGYEAGRCNDGTYDAQAPLPVASLPGCIGGLPGLYDMAGNVSEWEDHCSPALDHTPGDDSCDVRGGSYVAPQSVTRCDFLGTSYRSATSTTIGFRCCSR